MYPLEGEFWGYVGERLAIRQRRLSGAPGPWTADPILREFKFTNVLRAWDRTSEWIFTNIGDPHQHRPELWQALAFCRWVCRVETLRAVGYANRKHLGRAEKIMRAMVAAGEPVFTAAYMIRSDAGVDKITYVLDKVLRPAFEQLGDVPPSRAAPPRSMEEWNETFRSFHGWGGFMAQEVLLDLDRYQQLGALADRATWAWAGPGALRGAARVLGEPVGQQEVALAVMRGLKARIPAGSGLPPMTVHDIEFNLCEFDKYMRVKLGEGRPKQKFKPRIS